MNSEELDAVEPVGGHGLIDSGVSLPCQEKPIFRKRSSGPLKLMGRAIQERITIHK